MFPLGELLFRDDWITPITIQAVLGLDLQVPAGVEDMHSRLRIIPMPESAIRRIIEENYYVLRAWMILN
jgi:hypothetical protein